MSPGAMRKLSLWVKEWGSDGVWVLLRPVTNLPVQISNMRHEGIRDELLRLGVKQVEMREISPEPGGTHDAIYVVVEK